MQHTDETISNTTDVIDSNHYERCRFEGCILVYRGGELPYINGCQFDNCSWQFHDAADRTLSLLHQFYHGMGEGGVKMVEATFAQLRQPDRPRS